MTRRSRPTCTATRRRPTRSSSPSVNPNILHDAGLTSPYPHLWSLPVRVRDPRLQALADILEDSNALQWVVVGGASFGTWGAEPIAAQHQLDQRNGEVATDGDWHIFGRS
jgi:hypothetical protein